MKKGLGFTLIEMMITVAIIAIIASIAYPSFQEQIRKSRRADGISALMGLHMAQQRLRANCRFYAQQIDTTAGATNDCQGTAADSKVAYVNQSSEGYYALSIAAGTATGNAYTIVADPQGNQAADTDCDPLQLQITAGSREGVKTPADCWD